MAYINPLALDLKITVYSGTEALQWLFAVFIAISLLLNGAADPDVRPLFGIWFVVGLILVMFLPLRHSPVRPLLRRSLFLCLGLALWVGLQVLPLPLWLPVHPVWRDLSVTLGTEHGYLSVNPSATWHALPTLILPLMVFVTSITITQSDALAFSLWHKLTYVGLLVVVVSVVRQMFFPDSLVFSGQALRIGQFSGVFINRNVAASAFGLASFALLGSLTIHLAQDRSLRKKKYKRRQSQNFWTYVFLVSSLFLIAICLILTRSRAGSLGGLLLLLPCFTLILRHGLRKKRPHWQPWRWLLGSIFIALSTLVIFLSVYGEPVLSRVNNTNDSLRWCTWGATIEAINDNLVFGTGFGTFRDIFPMYRDATCDSAHIIWLRAHNSFLELYLGLGLPALILVGVVGLSFAQIISTGIGTRQRLKGIPITMAGAVIFVAAHSLVDFPLQIPGIALYFAALMGVGTTLCMQRSKAVRSRHLSSSGSTKAVRLKCGSEIRLSR